MCLLVTDKIIAKKIIHIKKVNNLNAALKMNLNRLPLRLRAC